MSQQLGGSSGAGPGRPAAPPQRPVRPQIPVLCNAVLSLALRTLHDRKTIEARSLGSNLHRDLRLAFHEIDRLLCLYVVHGTNPNDTHAGLCFIHNDILTRDQIFCSFVASTLGNWMACCDREIGGLARHPSLSDDEKLRQTSLQADRVEILRTSVLIYEWIWSSYNRRFMETGGVPANFGHVNEPPRSAQDTTATNNNDNNNDNEDDEEDLDIDSDETTSEGGDDEIGHGPPVLHQPGAPHVAPATPGNANMSPSSPIQTSVGSTPPAQRAVAASKEPPMGEFRRGRPARLLPRTASLAVRPSMAPGGPVTYTEQNAEQKPATAGSCSSGDNNNNDTTTTTTKTTNTTDTTNTTANSVPAVAGPAATIPTQNLAATILRAAGLRPDLVGAPLNDNLRQPLPRQNGAVPGVLRRGVDRARATGRLQYDQGVEGGLAWAKGKWGHNGECRLAPYQDAVVKAMKKFWEEKDAAAAAAAAAVDKTEE